MRHLTPDISHINSFVANFVSEFASKYAMFSRRVGMDRFYLFTDYTVLPEELMNDKFSVIDAFRRIKTEAKQLPSLKYGIFLRYEIMKR